MKQKKKYGCIVLSILVCIGSILLCRMQFQKQYDVQLHQSKKNYETSLLSIQQIIENAEQTLDKASIALPKEGDAYARIAIDRIPFQNNVYYGDTDALLNKGIGHYMGSHLPGEGGVILLAGHNGTEFYHLRNVKKDDIVKLHTTYGDYTYQVYDMVIKEASEFTSNDLLSDKETLIMYCCYPFDELGTSQRYFVYASYISGPILRGNAS